MSKFVYYTKEGKFEADYDDNPFDNLHSPNEETPALIWWDGRKIWYFEGKLHRLTGPAIIWYNGEKWFYLNDICYEFEDWIQKHPNIDIYLEANGYITNAEKALWKLKNL